MGCTYATQHYARTAAGKNSVVQVHQLYPSIILLCIMYYLLCYIMVYYGITMVYYGITMVYYGMTMVCISVVNGMIFNIIDLFTYDNY